jgi:GMP synthase-like glutamine amidotransferase
MPARTEVGMNRILCISLLGEPGVARREIFEGMADGSSDWQWIASRLRERGLAGKVELEGVDASLGERLPSPDDFDGVIVGGSIHNVNEGRDWQCRTIDWLGDWRSTGRPLFGICGGHQMATVTLGGTVDRIDKINGAAFSETGRLDLTEHGREHFLFEGVSEEGPAVHFGNFDHVTQLPDGATLLATFRGIVATLDHGRDWYSTQFHPESTANCMVVAWDGSLPADALRYRDTPDGARIIENFLRGTGLV